MSIAFILRMISNTISGKGGHPQSINEEIERAKKRAAAEIPAAGKEAMLPYAGCKTRSPPGAGCPS